MGVYQEPRLRVMQDELSQWGQWARGTELSYGLRRYESPALMMVKIKMEQHREPSKVRVTMLDEQFIALERHIQSLRVCRPELFAWMVAFYLLGWPIRHLAEKTGKSRDFIDKQLIAAESWLDSRVGLYHDIMQGVHG